MTWDFGDGSVARGDANPCHEYAVPGRYVVRATLVDALTCATEHVVTLEVPEPLSVALGGTVGCAGTEACFTALVTGGTGPYQIEWSFDGGAAGPAADPACFTFPGPSYAAEVYVRDAAGCLASAAMGGIMDAPPADVGGVLFVDDHGDAFAASVEATLHWSGDLGAPRPPGDAYWVGRGTLPTAIGRVPGTAGHATTSYRDGTPGDLARSPIVHYYLVLAEDGCGSLSVD